MFPCPFCSDEEDDSDEDVKPQKKELKKVSLLSHCLINMVSIHGVIIYGTDCTVLLESHRKWHDAIILRAVELKKPLKMKFKLDQTCATANLCNTVFTINKTKPFRCSQLTSRCQSSQGLGPVCARLRAYEKNFYMLLHSLPTPPFASFKLWQSVVPEWSLASVGPSHPCTRWPSTRFFHPVGSRTHLFSTSKTQGLRGVMIGFLLCNLLEFCLTSKMAFSCPLHAHTPSEVCTCCKQLSVDL